MAGCHALDHSGEPGLRIKAIEFGALQHGVENGGTLAADFGSEKQEILPRYGNVAQRALSDIIVDRQPTIIGIAGQRIPAAERILDRPGEGGFR